MRKRKVLAFLLALSMTVSTNGMVVYATEPTVSVTTEESGAEQTETGESSDLGDKDENNLGDSDHSKSENDEDGEDKKDQDSEIKDDQGEKDEQTEITETPVDPDEEDATEEKEIEDEEKDELLEEKIDEVRLETFADETGLEITYDAVEAQSNADEVTIVGDTLTAVPSNIEGVVDLRNKDFTEIAAEAFSGKDKITYIMLPKTVTTIGQGTFKNCTSLKGISIPSRLTEVKNNTFQGCTALTQLALPNSVTSIGASAFQGDIRLYMLHMVGADYSKLKTIGESAFEDCRSLELFCSDEEYNLPQSLTSIGEKAFKGCKKISSVIMGDEIETLGQGVYQNCYGIKNISISSKLAVIPEDAFANCTSLAEIKFSTVGPDMKIEARAFSGCIGLGYVELPDKICAMNGDVIDVAVKADAFAGCTTLKRVVVKGNRTKLEKGAFPAIKTLCLLVGKDSQARNYADGVVQIILVDDQNQADGYYTYTAQKLGYKANTDQISVKVTTDKSSKGKDIKDIKGVKPNTVCYIWIEKGAKGQDVMVSSVKCNGETIKKNDGYYTFKMPVGGAAITVELKEDPSIVTYIQSTKDSDIAGRLSADVNYDFQKNTGYLKVGQTTKFYLTNSNSGEEERIPVSQVKYKESQYSTKGVISIAADGTIKALKAGTAMVEGTVTVWNGAETRNVTVSLTIIVESTGIDHISLQVTDYNKYTLIPEEDENGKGFVGASISTTDLTAQKVCTFQLKAMAFASEENDEPMEVAFTWSTSDAKVAKLAKTSTTAASAVNTITVPTSNASGGEATITVSGKGADGETIKQTFIVKAQDYTPRLTASKVTINPKQVDGATKIGIISAYGQKIDEASKDLLKVYDAKTDKEISGLSLNYESENDSVYTYGVVAVPDMKQLTYNTIIKVKLQDRGGEYEIPLTIVVKESLPNPTVSFNSKAPKINLFYAKDGTEIKPVISKLGDAKVSKYRLEPLTEPGNKNYENDVKFTENFDVRKDADGNPIIFQKSEELACNTSKKPVVTGYLVMQFEGYDYKEDNKEYNKKAEKWFKITIPTQTVAPTYVLDRTTDTFSDAFIKNQTVDLQLLDKKTKKPIAWDDAYTVSAETSSTCDAEPEIFKGRGMIDGVETDVVNIRVTFKPGQSGGKLNMKVENSKWANEKSFKCTYTIKVDKNFRKLSLQKATITLNANYPEKTEEFKLLTNQWDTKELLEAEVQDFVEQSTYANAAQYDLLDVSCTGGEGTVKFDLEGHEKEEIKTGSYRYVYAYPDEYTGKNKSVTLTVKVVKTEPTVTLKGSNVFNLLAYKLEDGVTSYVETSEMTVTTKNLPSEYEFDEDKSFESIAFTTKGYTDEKVSDYFDFVWSDEEGKIKISLKQSMPLKTYTLKMTPYYKNSDSENEICTKKPINFNIKICRNTISVKLTAKGKTNLLDRGGECTEKNGIRYTAVFSNLTDTIDKVVLLDASNGRPLITQEDKVSELFDAQLSADGKSFFVVPKPDAELKNNQNYELRVWIKTKNYTSPTEGYEGGMYPAATVKVKTAQILPKVKTDKSTVNLYLSSKGYEATFKVQKSDAKAIGEIVDIAFGEKDMKANDSFVITSEPNDDGSLQVHLKLKNAVSYGCNTTNKITMYVKYKDQGTNTAGTAVTMNVKINK